MGFPFLPNLLELSIFLISKYKVRAYLWCFYAYIMYFGHLHPLCYIIGILMRISWICKYCLVPLGILLHFRIDFVCGGVHWSWHTCGGHWEPALTRHPSIRLSTLCFQWYSSGCRAQQQGLYLLSCLSGLFWSLFKWCLFVYLCVW